MVIRLYLYILKAPVVFLILMAKSFSPSTILEKLMVHAVQLCSMESHNTYNYIEIYVQY